MTRLVRWVLRLPDQIMLPFAFSAAVAGFAITAESIHPGILRGVQAVTTHAAQTVWASATTHPLITAAVILASVVAAWFAAQLTAPEGDR